MSETESLPLLTRIVDGRIVPIAGTWELDGLHTHTGFAIRHLLTLMRGRFREQRGTIVIADDPTASTVEVVIEAASLDTTHPAADDTVRGEMLLDVAQFPTIEFRSTAVTPNEDGRWTIVGDLTIKGVTHAVELATEFLGAVHHPLSGQPVMSFTASTEITRSQFGMTMSLDVADNKGAVVIGDRVELQLDIEAGLPA